MLPHCFSHSCLRSFHVSLNTSIYSRVSAPWNMSEVFISLYQFLIFLLFLTLLLNICTLEIFFLMGKTRWLNHFFMFSFEMTFLDMTRMTLHMLSLHAWVSEGITNLNIMAINVLLYLISQFFSIALSSELLESLYRKPKFER